jgi:hypothetical protein
MILIRRLAGRAWKRHRLKSLLRQPAAVVTTVGLAPLIYPTKEVVGDFNITIIIFAIDIAKQVCGAQGCNNIIFRSSFFLPKQLYVLVTPSRHSSNITAYIYTLFCNNRSKRTSWFLSDQVSLFACWPLARHLQ